MHINFCMRTSDMIDPGNYNIVDSLKYIRRNL